MSVFLTGGTGYLGSYALDRLLRQGAQVTALVRAADAESARVRLWRSLQLHRSAEEVAAVLRTSESTVRNHVFQARKLLREELLSRYPEYARHFGGEGDAS